VDECKPLPAGAAAGGGGGGNGGINMSGLDEVSRCKLSRCSPC